LAGGSPFWRDICYWLVLLSGCGLAYAIGPHQPLGLLPAISLMAWQPFAEEVFFRGFLQSNLLDTQRGKRRRYGVSLANLATSILFAALHFLHHPPVWALAVFFPSLLFGWMRERYGSVYPSFLLHAAFNAAFFAG
jgi:uncharacterized protein